MPKILEHKTCWLCGGTLNELYLVKVAEHNYNNRYMRCSNCGLVIATPYKADSLDRIAQSEDSENYLNNIELYSSLVSTEGFSYLFNKIERFWKVGGKSGKGHLLEIGCAAGYFLDIARSSGWTVAGTEMFDPMSDWAKKELNLEIHQGTLETFQGSSDFFDMIVSIEVLEHVYDPNAFLSKVYRLLKVGGMFFLTTPNVYSNSYYPPENTTPILNPEDHLNLFSVETLKRAVEAAGFKKIIVVTDGEAGWQLQLTAWKLTADPNGEIPIENNSLNQAILIDKKDRKLVATLMPVHLFIKKRMKGGLATHYAKLARYIRAKLSK